MADIYAQEEVQAAEIRKSIVRQKLIGMKKDVTSLLKHYTVNESNNSNDSSTGNDDDKNNNFKKNFKNFWHLGIEYLNSKYQIRRTRGDGNCFYRSFLYSYLDNLLDLYNNNHDNSCSCCSCSRSAFDNKKKAEAELDRITIIITDSKHDLIRNNYSVMLFDSFLDEFLSLLSILFTLTKEQLLLVFNDDDGEESDDDDDDDNNNNNSDTNSNRNTTTTTTTASTILDF